MKGIGIFIALPFLVITTCARINNPYVPEANPSYRGFYPTKPLFEIGSKVKNIEIDGTGKYLFWIEAGSGYIGRYSLETKTKIASLTSNNLNDPATLRIVGDELWVLQSSTQYHNGNIWRFGSLHSNTLLFISNYRPQNVSLVHTGDLCLVQNRLYLSSYKNRSQGNLFYLSGPEYTNLSILPGTTAISSMVAVKIGETTSLICAPEVGTNGVAAGTNFRKETLIALNLDGVNQKNSDASGIGYLTTDPLGRPITFDNDLDELFRYSKDLSRVEIFTILGLNLKNPYRIAARIRGKETEVFLADQDTGSVYQVTLPE